MIITDGLYLCDPEKNIICPKTHCAVNGGPCRLTTDKKYGCEGVEVEVVKHGHWIVRSFDMGGVSPVQIPFCSVCDKPNEAPRRSKRCPNCAAIMDEVEND